MLSSVFLGTSTGEHQIFVSTSTWERAKCKQIIMNASEEMPTEIKYVLT